MISVVLCVYNGSKYLDKCIKSILGQTIEKGKIELIAIDDISTDNSVDILKKYKHQYPENIVIVEKTMEEKKARMSSRNIGCNMARGEYIMFCDQDDWYEVDAFDILHNLMDEDKEIDYIEYRFNYVDSEGCFIKTSKSMIEQYTKLYIGDDCQKKEYIKRGILPGYTYAWCRIYRKEYLDKYKIQHNSEDKYSGFADNYFNGFVLTYAKKIGKCNLSLYNYRKWQQSYLGRTSEEEVFFERMKTGLIYYEECEKRGLLEDNNYKLIVEFLFFRIYVEKTIKVYDKIFGDTNNGVMEEIKRTVKRLCPDYKNNELIWNRQKLVKCLDLLNKSN